MEVGTNYMMSIERSLCINFVLRETVDQQNGFDCHWKASVVLSESRGDLCFVPVWGHLLNVVTVASGEVIVHLALEYVGLVAVVGEW